MFLLGILFYVYGSPRLTAEIAKIMSGAIPFCKNCGGFSSIVLHSRCYPDDPKDMQLHDFTMPPQIQSFVINASASRVGIF